MENDCGLLISVLFHKIKKRMNINMQKMGLTGGQSRIMHYIIVKCAQEPVFQRDIENAFGLSRSTATGILQIMEKNGLILRKNSPSDARLKSLIPTNKAKSLNAQVCECLNQIEQQLSEGLTNAQIALFIETAEKMSANLDQLNDGDIS